MIGIYIETIASNNLTGEPALIAIFVGVAALVAGYLLRKVFVDRKLGSAQNQAKSILKNAKRDSDTEKKRRLLELKDEQHRLRQEFEKETREQRQELRTIEKRIQQREENLDRKVDILDKKEEDVTRREKTVNSKQIELGKREVELRGLIEEENKRLQRVSGMSRTEARELLLQRVEEECRKDSATMIRRIEADARERGEKEARRLISLAIQRCSSDYVSELTVTTVTLPSDEMKGRIIGREGRNIRTLEAATGIDIIIDDTPEAVILSGFDPIRKEIARITLERLMMDGRIHPARIEEMVQKVEKEMDNTIKETGEQAAFDCGVHNLHVEVIKLIGRLRYRSSYGQNILEHSKEVSRIMGMMAAELHEDEKIARRVGLLHDIGKALTYEVEGPHALIGADFAKRYGEGPIIVNGIAAHHGEEEPRSVIAILSQAGDTLSAARPGARSETLEIYIKRLEKLEEIANSFKGIEKAYAMQAGREIRVIVKPDQISDDEALLTARTISKKIEGELEYPGQVKVTVIREIRAVEYAR